MYGKPIQLIIEVLKVRELVCFL